MASYFRGTAECVLVRYSCRDIADTTIVGGVPLGYGSYLGPAQPALHDTGPVRSVCEIVYIYAH